MPRWQITAQALSPIVLRRERQSQRSEGGDHIPGTQVRGAFARAYLWQHGQADEIFRRLFNEATGVRFGPLDPGEHCFPRTAHSCKRRPGFRAEDGDMTGGHGIVDVLTELLRWSLSGEPPEPERFQCPECANELKPITGFYRCRNGRFQEVKRNWQKVMRAHVGIDRLTATAAPAIFYHLPALEAVPGEGNEVDLPTLWGWIDCDEECRDILARVLEREDGILRIGHARTRGYGKVQVQIGEALPNQPRDWEEWSQKLLEKMDAGLDPARHFLFTIDLPSGAIIVDRLLRYSLDPAEWVDWLPPIPPAPLRLSGDQAAGRSFGNGTLRCVAAVSQHERLRGWNFAQGLPRADEWMVCRGAVYAYLFEGDSADRQSLLTKLRELDQTGVGARLSEGYGRVVISDEFHVKLGK